MSVNVSGLASGGSNSWELIDDNWSYSKASHSVANIDGTSPSAFNKTLIDLYVADVQNWIYGALDYNNYNEWLYTCSNIHSTNITYPGTSVILRKLEIENLFEFLEARRSRVINLSGTNGVHVTAGYQSPTNTYEIRGLEIGFTLQNGTTCSTRLFSYSSDTPVQGKIYGKK